MYKVHFNVQILNSLSTKMTSSLGKDAVTKLAML